MGRHRPVHGLRRDDRRCSNALAGTVGEFGWGGAAATWFWVDPTEDLAFVFMTQVVGLPEFFLLRRDLHSLV